jgi:hypothetical protein
MKKWSWLLAMVLGVGMMVCVGCEDDDDDEGGGTAAATTTGGTTSGGTTSGGTTADGTTSGGTTTGGGTTGGTTTGTPPVAPIVAPTLIEPAAGASLQGGVVDNTIKVIFAWSDVDGAGDYILEVNGSEYITTGSSMALNLGWGDYTWRVWARSSTINMPSGYRNFSIVPTILFIPGL